MEFRPPPTVSDTDGNGASLRPLRPPLGDIDAVVQPSDVGG